MTDLRKAAEMALEALLTCDVDYDYDENSYNTFDAEDVSEAIESLRQALAQPEFDTPESHIVKWSIPVDPNNFGEPITQQDHGFDRTASHLAGEYVDTAQPKHEAIYEYSEIGSKTRIRAAKTWQGLTDDEIENILDCGRGGLVDIKKAEAKLREKNEF